MLLLSFYYLSTPHLFPSFPGYSPAVSSGSVCASQQLSIHPPGSPYIPVVISHSWLLFPTATPVENTLQTNTHGHGYVYRRPCNSTSILLILTPPHPPFPWIKHASFESLLVQSRFSGSLFGLSSSPQWKCPQGIISRHLYL